MEILINKEWLKALHDVLVHIYQGTADPISSGLPLVHDYDESLISVCVERHNTEVYNKTLYPHILQKAAVLMHSIISFHPFVDGNKRTALLAIDFYLCWNGYDFIIPNDADEFTISVAKGEKNLNNILRWLEHNSKRTAYTLVRHWLCEHGLDVFSLSTLIDGTPRTVYVPYHALIFFREKIIAAQQRKSKERKKSSKRIS